MLRNRRSGFETVLRTGLVLAGLLGASALTGTAQAQFDPRRVQPEAPAVAARYPKPDAAYATPGFAAGREDFTRHAEMMAFLAQQQDLIKGARLITLGASQKGLVIPALMLSRNGNEADFRDPARATAFLIGLQHGNEPAGGEALLAIAQLFATPAWQSLLDVLNVIIVPRSNPDGAEIFNRVTANGIDVNRDHTLQRTPEGQALGLVFRTYSPHLVIDAHEFTVGGRWVTAFGGVQRPDAMIQYAATPNLSPALSALQDGLVRHPMLTALDRAGLSHDWYHTMDAAAGKAVNMGGIGPDTGRNVAGLRNAVSFLVETRGVGLGRQNFERRVHTHVVAIEAALRSAAADAPALLSRTRQIAAEIAATPPGSPLTIRAAQTQQARQMTFVNPASGLDMPTEIVWRSSLAIQPLMTRPRPAAYILPASETEAATRLTALGVAVTRLTNPLTVSAEHYRVLSIKEEAKADVRGDDVGAGQIVTGEFAVEVATPTMPAGSFVVRLDQPLAHLAAAIMEPESPVGYVANRVIAIPDSKILPIWRVMSLAALP
ncbi:MAG: M14 family metallopeptidase [Bosea sp. (in: a-proteobacteria)]|jgi:hypothetical protein